MLRTGSRAALWVGAIVILTLVGALYAPTIQFKFVWDDDQIIYGRADYRSPSHWWDAVRQPLDFSPNYFRPLALSSLLLQIWVWGDNPAPFHAANVLIHWLNTALVMVLGVRWLRGSAWGLLVGALYGVHPALIESVAFVSSRYDLMTALFLLLALWLEGRLRGAARIGGVSLLFLLALLCKEMALVFPLVLLLWQVAQGARLSTLWRTERALYGALGVAMLCYLALRYAALGYLFTGIVEGTQIEAGTPLQHLLLVGRTLATLIGLVLFPFFSITPAHHSELPVPLRDGWAWAQLGLSGLIVSGVAWLARSRPQVGWLLTAGLIALLPVLNLRPLEFAFGLFTAERFLTFPLALFILGLGCLFLSESSRHESPHQAVSSVAKSQARKRRPNPPREPARLPILQRRAPVAYAPILLWGIGALVTTAYNLPNWRDAETLWKWLTFASPQSPLGFSNLSDLYNKQGRHSEALKYAEQAIRIAPNSGMGYVNKGVALLRMGDPEGAIALFRRATEIEPDNTTAWNNFAVMLSEKGNHTEAEQIIRKRVLGKPPLYMGHQALGLIHTRQARLDLAEQEFRRAYALLPNPAGSIPDDGLQQLRSASKWIAAAHYWMNRHQLALAETHLQLAATREPDQIAYGIALARLRILQHRPAEAKQVLDELKARGYTHPGIEGLRREAVAMLQKAGQNLTQRKPYQPVQQPQGQ